MTEESDSSCNSSPAPSSFSSLIEIDSHSIGSTSTQDSFSALPLADGSDSMSNTSDLENPGTRPIAPPRRRRAEKKKEDNVVVKDRLIGVRTSKERPKPSPRQSLSEEVKVDTTQVKPEGEPKKEAAAKSLIQLDSVDDDFDPFSSPKSQTVGTVEKLRERNEGSPSLLRRTAAIKKQNGRPSRENSLEKLKVDSSVKAERSLDGIESFDPLCNSSDKPTQSKEEPRKSVHELMQNWELHTLTKSQNQPRSDEKPFAHKAPHLGFPSPPHFTSSQNTHQPLARLSHFTPHQIQQASMNMSNLKLPNNSSPHSSVGSQRTSGSSVASADRSSDPFSDLLEQSLSNKSGENPSPKKNWETFD